MLIGNRTLRWSRILIQILIQIIDNLPNTRNKNVGAASTYLPNLNNPPKAQKLKTMLLAYFDEHRIEAGCDEAGRGCLAGPVFAGAVILPKDFKNDLLNDSKKLKESDRYKLRIVVEQQALAWAVASVDHAKIDQINILNASYLAMHLALDQLKLRPELVLVDGNRFKAYKNLPHECIVKGDGKYYSIAAASILAKTYRDDYMKQMHQKYPIYTWNSNKGYPTKAHRAAIKQHGASPIHRKSFRLLPEGQQKLPL